MKSECNFHDKHIFAIYTHTPFSNAASMAIGKQCIIQDPDVWHRVSRVLHACPGQEIIIFGNGVSITLKITSLDKKNLLEGVVVSVDHPQPLQPTINLYQGILKREAWNDVAYYAAQMGVASLTPVITQKSQRTWGGEKERERTYNVMIAACEQAKQFVLPVINEPCVLNEQLANSVSFYCESEGKPFLELIQTTVQRRPESLTILIGPEGGFAQQELHLLPQAHVPCYKLTPTVLRAQDAVMVCLGALRSVL
jgi:16S rRNA (uracil1498-N3)-methyltransferase